MGVCNPCSSGCMTWLFWAASAYFNAIFLRHSLSASYLFSEYSFGSEVLEILLHLLAMEPMVLAGSRNLPYPSQSMFCLKPAASILSSVFVHLSAPPTLKSPLTSMG